MFDPIPIDPTKRRVLIKWLLAHPLWTHPAKVKMPDDFDEMFEPIENSKNFRMIHKEEWPEHEFNTGSFHECVDIDVVYVNPKTERIEDDETLNTAFRVWLEAGGWCWDHNQWMHCHDLDLDCGAADLETACLELAVRVKYYYGEGRERLHKYTVST